MNKQRAGNFSNNAQPAINGLRPTHHQTKTPNRLKHRIRSGSRKGEILSARVTRRHQLTRNLSVFLHYLHLDLTMTGLVLAILLAGGVTGKFAALRSMGSAIPEFSISADSGDSEPNGAPVESTLLPSMKAALDIVVQRYRVSPEALRPVFEAVQSIARERKLDPLLLIAVISVESRFNPYSQSPMGALGLMQIIPRYHQDKVPPTAGDQPFLDPVTNVRIGAHVLQEAIQRQGGLVEGLQYYAGAADDEDKTYATKVLAEKHRLEQTVRR